MPRCSLSMSMSFISKSAILSCSVHFHNEIATVRNKITATRSREEEKHKARSDWPLTGRLEHECDGVRSIVGLDGDDVVVAGAAEHLGHVIEVHAHGEVAVAAVVLEPLGAEEQGDERDVAGVHGLQREPGPGAVKVGIGDQLADGLQDLLEEAPLHQP
jgi:hypothetical protein